MPCTKQTTLQATTSPDVQKVNSGKELIVFRLVLGTIVCLFTARIDCFSLFFFNINIGPVVCTPTPATAIAWL
jgi:hypothetical protein